MMSLSLSSTFSYIAAAALALGSLSGCADDDGDTGGNICDDMGTQYDAYSADLTKIGDMGAVKVRLMEATPAPPERGMNAWKFQILDKDSDQPVSAATITAVEPFMPAHGHGSNTAPAIGTTGANGEISVDDIDFMMPGVWTVTVDVDNGGTPDSATFAFCIDG